MIRTALIAGLLFAACSSSATPTAPVSPSPSIQEGAYPAQYHDAARASAALETLSSNAFEGRKTGEPGNLKAQDWIIGRLETFGVAALHNGDYRAAFETPDFSGRQIEGTNILAVIDGRRGQDAPVIVMSAHYDHLGTGEDGIYNGTDDNASGVVALLETVAWFQENPPENDLVFAFFDAEEQGLQGHMVPAVFVELPERKRIIGCDRFELGPHVGAKALCHLGLQGLGQGIER